MSQLASSLSEKPKGTLPSQPITNPRNSSQAHLAQEDHVNQCNLIHTLRSRNKLITKYQHHQVQNKYSPLIIPLHLNLTPITLKKTSQMKMCTSLQTLPK